MNQVYLLIGGNLGDRFDFLKKARQGIENKIGKLVEVSSIYETAPWGFEAEQNFLNQVILAQTDLSPQEVLRFCLGIEDELGRERESEQYESRTMDIDILFFNDEIIETKDLTVPHPKLHQRRFTLEPLAEIAPRFMHPVFNKTLQELLHLCEDQSQVNKM